jgi:hypothetical protein
MKPDRSYNHAMQVTSRIISLGIAITLGSFAATPVARVISKEPLNIDGIIGPARNFVPLSIGDEIATDNASAVVQFPDGSVVTLQPHSKLRIESQPSGPVARVILGSAIYDEGPTSSGVLTKRAGNPAARIPSGAPLSGPAGHRTSNRQLGPPAPQAGVFTGSLSSVETGPQIVTPSGVTINLTSVINPSTGATTFVVSSIQQTVSLPGGGTAVVTVTSGSLIGATVGGTTGSGFTFTPPGSSAPLTSQQVSTAVQIGVQQAIDTGVSSGTLPSGTQMPSPAPVGSGQFSASGG